MSHIRNLMYRHQGGWLVNSNERTRTVGGRWWFRVVYSPRRGVGTVVVRDLYIADPDGTGVDIVFHSGKVDLAEIDRTAEEAVKRYSEK